MESARVVWTTGDGRSAGRILPDDTKPGLGTGIVLTLMEKRHCWISGVVFRTFS